MSYFGKRYHPPGTSPGTLREHAEPQASTLRLKLFDYNAQSFNETSLESVAEIAAAPAPEGIRWLHLQGQPDPQTLQQLGKQFGLHPLALEDVLNTGQRPKVDSYPDQLFITMNLPRLDEEGELSFTQVSLFLTDRMLLSFHHGEDQPFQAVVERLRKRSGRIRERGTDYLLYALLDVIVDQGFPLLEQLGETIEELEEELLDSPGKPTLARIHLVRRDLLLLRRNLWPQREVMANLNREGHGFIHDSTQPYLRDCYDHTIQILDLLESYREMAASMLDVYLTSLSHKLNEVMKVLTVIATIFIPLTFIVGVYGMNFAGDSPWAMPELAWYYSYPILWLFMLSVAGGMIFAFRRRGWF